MGVLDKLKNALFEVEYVEVEEPPKKEKKNRVKEVKKENKPIAKKIVLPGKKEEKIEELEEEELRDEDFEIRPKDEQIKEKSDDNFKFMDDKDFEMDEEDYIPDKPEILNVVSESKEEKEFVEERNSEEFFEHPDDFYQEKEENTNNLYRQNKSYDVPVHEYGRYERYEDKNYFKPSPIISPIYGILDKNYKKEDVREKKEVRISSYSRGSLNVDDIRNKAYGEKKEDIEDTKFEVEEDDNNLMVDLNEESKPEVKELTVGDAVEYFQDLGLEYNVDYVDMSSDKEKKATDKQEEPKDESKEEPKEKIAKEVEEKPEEKVKKETEVEEDTTSADTDDNLFDLIDSMYQEEN